MKRTRWLVCLNPSVRHRSSSRSNWRPSLQSIVSSPRQWYCRILASSLNAVSSCTNSHGSQESTSKIRRTNCPASSWNINRCQDSLAIRFGCVRTRYCRRARSSSSRMRKSWKRCRTSRLRLVSESSWKVWSTIIESAYSLSSLKVSVLPSLEILTMATLTLDQMKLLLPR